MELFTGGLVTAIATLVATLPAVYLGIRLERRHAERQTVKHRREAQLRVIHADTLYEARRWARNLNAEVQRGQPIGASWSASSHRSIRLMANDSLPVGIQGSLLRLADRLERLERAVTPHIATRLPPFENVGKRTGVPAGGHDLRDFIYEESLWLGMACDHFIEAIQAQLAKEEATKKIAELVDRDWGFGKDGGEGVAN